MTKKKISTSKSKLKEGEEFPPQPKYLLRTKYGDAGKVESVMGNYFIAVFKVKGRMAVPKNLIGDDISEIDEQTYNKATEKDVASKLLEMYKSSTVISESAEESSSNDSKPKKEKSKASTGNKTRDALNSLNIEQLKKVHTKLNLDPNTYNHLSGGLLKMSLVNKALGKINPDNESSVLDV